MLFSVVVPIYNIENFLPKCLESIINQTCKEFELILVDDGSTDNSGKICDEYALKDSRIKVIHKQNGGLVSARQEGSKVSVGKYIVPIDGDDWVDVNYLKNFKEAIDKTNADIICCGINCAFDENNYKSFPYSFKMGFYDKQNIKRHIFPCLIRNINGSYYPPAIWSKAFKRELYIPIQKNINIKIKNGEDRCVTYPCISNANSLYVSEKKYYFYRINQNSMIHNTKKGYSWENIKYIKDSFLQNLNQKDYNFLPQINRYLCHSLFNVSVSYCKTNDSYENIKKEIIYNLSFPENIEILNSTKFKVFSKDFLAQKAMKYHLIWLLKLYSILSKRLLKK